MTNNNSVDKKKMARDYVILFAFLLFVLGFAGIIIAFQEIRYNPENSELAYVAIGAILSLFAGAIVNLVGFWLSGLSKLADDVAVDTDEQLHGLVKKVDALDNKVRSSLSLQQQINQALEQLKNLPMEEQAQRQNFLREVQDEIKQTLADLPSSNHTEVDDPAEASYEGKQAEILTDLLITLVRHLKQIEFRDKTAEKYITVEQISILSETGILPQEDVDKIYEVLLSADQAS